MSKNADFITPFLLSCQTRNPKYISIAISSFHRLIISQSIPITKLELVLDSFTESTNLAIEIQLKILQCLPFLFQTYSTFINDKILFKLLSICSILQNSNKSNIVSNTASATLSQLINIVFEKINDEDCLKEIDKSYQVPTDNELVISVGMNAYDGQRIFQDLCLLLEHQTPLYLKTSYITDNFGFEILESVIKTNHEIFLKHTELGFLLRTKIVPILLRFFSSSKDFLILVRVSRLILLLIREQLEILKLEIEVILNLLNHVLTKDAVTPLWKKILSLEIYKQISSDSNLIKSLFVEFDYQNDTKHIFNDLLQNCYDILNENRHLLNTGEVVQPQVQPPRFNNLQKGDQPETPGLFVQKSTIKISFIDLLDKPDPPVINETYPLYLILQLVNNLSEVISHYLSIEADKQVLTQLIDQNYQTLAKVYQIFIFSSLDQEFFNKAIRSIQKLCHLSAVISINDSRDLFLKFLIKATLNLTGKSGYQYRNSVYHIGESIVGTISSTINQFATTPTHQQISYSRSINSRNIACFRVLISLSISIGPYLKENWSLIFISLQWMDYFINGSTDSYQDTSSPPQLSSQDLINLDNSIKKLDENINFYSNDTYLDIVKSLVSLSKELMMNDSFFNRQPILEQGDVLTVQPCSFNKRYPIDKLQKICKINPKKFLINDEQTWPMVSEVYFELVSNRSLSYETRIEVSKDFNSIIKYMAIDGFDSKASTTELKILDTLDLFVKKLVSLPNTDELLIFNCELEIQSQILDTLKNLLDKYGSSFQNWDLVFNIINSSFVKVSKNEKLKPVINSSFEGLKMILDEFLSSLPSSQFKILIDCISNFISQEIDLNISLNSISYFWLISDYLKGVLKKSTRRQISSKEELFDMIMTKNDDFELLYIYLLYVLAANFQDSRLQVRNGSSQTFFNIIDSHGDEFSQIWNNIYDLIFIELLEPTSLKHDNEWFETYSLTLNGFVKLYCRFFATNFDAEKFKYWNGLITFFNKLNKLGDIDLNLKIYKNFNDLISYFDNLPVEILKIIYKFWSSCQNMYNFKQNNQYQESLTSLMQCFPKLYQLVQPIIDITMLKEILTIFDSCVKYPILPDFVTNDNLKLTSLQDSIYQNLQNLIDDAADKPEYNSLILQELIAIIVLPFLTRSKIIEKFSKLKQTQSFKIPSFTAISHLSIELLNKKLTKCLESPIFYINDGSLLKILQSLLEPISKRSTGISIKKNLWIQCMDTLMNIIETCIKYQLPLSWFELLIELISILNSYDLENVEYEQIDVENLQKIDEIIISNIDKLPVELEIKFFRIHYQNSFLYELNEIDKLITSFKSVEELNGKLGDKLICSSPDLTISKRLSLKQFNLLKLIDLSILQDAFLSLNGLHFVELRIVHSIYRLTNTANQINRSPVPALQKFEILSLLRRFNEISHLKQDKALRKDLLSLLPLISKIDSLDQMLFEIIS